MAARKQEIGRAGPPLGPAWSTNQIQSYSTVASKTPRPDWMADPSLLPKKPPTKVVTRGR